jgi:uncharacterized membrane protein
MWRSAGVWLVVALVVYLSVGFIRSLVSPEALSVSFGLTRADGASAYVQVYGIRALFLALYATALILRKDIKALSLYVLVAAAIPAGDAVLIAVNDGAVSAIATNVVVTLVLLATSRLLQRQTRRAA